MQARLLRHACRTCACAGGVKSQSGAAAGLTPTAAGAIQGLRGGRAPSEPDEPAFHGASLWASRVGRRARFSMVRARRDPHIPQRAGCWKPRRSSGERESPAFAGLCNEMGECGAARPCRTTVRRWRGVVEYAPVPQRMREFTRVETCKTQRCARSLKREACFFGRFQGETPGRWPKLMASVSEPVELTWFSDYRSMFQKITVVLDPVETAWFSDPNTTCILLRDALESGVNGMISHQAPR